MEKPVQPLESEEQKVQDFITEYNNLCKKHGYSITSQPAWLGTNHGSFEMTVQMSVNKLEQK